MSKYILLLLLSTCIQPKKKSTVELDPVPIPNVSFEWMPSSLRFEKGSLYFGTSDNKLIKLDLQNYHFDTLYSAAQSIVIKPLILNDRILFITNEPMVRCIQKENKKELWVLKIPDRTKTDMVTDGSDVYLSVRSRGILSINAKSGKINWEFNDFKNDITTSPLTLKDTSLFFSDIKGNLFRLNCHTGKLDHFISYSGFALSKSVNNDDTLFTSFDDFYKGGGGLSIINASTFQKIKEIPLKAEVNFAPITFNNGVIIGTYDNLVNAYSNSGSLLWSYKLDKGENMITNPEIIDSQVYFYSSKLKFYCLEIQNGTLKYIIKPDKGGIIMMHKEDNKKYVAVGEKYLYILNE
jgi:outer membrane protein assembly factor BamB